MDASFQDLVNRVIEEQGIAIFENTNRCKVLLHSYAKGGFKKEIRNFLHSLELNCYQEMLAMKEPEAAKPQLIQRLQDEYILEQAAAEETISLLETLITYQKKTDEKTLAELEQAAHQGNYYAQYTLGTLYEKLRRYSDSIHWLREAAEHYMPYYEQSLKVQELPEQPEKPQVEANQISIAVAPVQDAQTSGSVYKGFVKIAGGTFMMGSPETEPERIDNETAHQITVGSFYMGIYEVTQQEYEDCIQMNPSHFKSPKLPVENVNWFDAIAYCNARSTQEGLFPAYTVKGELIRWNWSSNGYRLPTEAEWEYACRSGTDTPFNTGKNITTEQANYDGTYPYNNNQKGTYQEKTSFAGSFPPNHWGLYDMHGNVWEWCWDWYGQYDLRNSTNPAGPNTGSNRVIRGGSWGGGARYLRAAYRCSSSPFARDNYLGFRIIRPI